MNAVHLLLKDAKLHLRDSIYKLYINHKYSVPLSERCQTPFGGFYLQVIYKYSVPPSEGFRLQVKNKHVLLKDANLLLRVPC